MTRFLIGLGAPSTALLRFLRARCPALRWELASLAFRLIAFANKNSFVTQTSTSTLERVNYWLV